MPQIAANTEGHSYDENENNDTQKTVFDLGAFVGDLTFDEDATSDDISFKGLQQELEECKHDDDVEEMRKKQEALADELCKKHIIM